MSGSTGSRVKDHFDADAARFDAIYDDAKGPVYSFTRLALRAVARTGKPMVFYLHPWEIDPDHPRIPLPKRIAATHYFNLGATEGRLRKLLKDFRFAPMSEVLGVH